MNYSDELLCEIHFFNITSALGNKIAQITSALLSIYSYIPISNYKYVEAGASKSKKA